jgi:hypothetical protein
VRQIPSAGMMPNGMISTGNPGTGMPQMIPTASQMSPGIAGVPNGEGDALFNDIAQR